MINYLPTPVIVAGGVLVRTEEALAMVLSTYPGATVVPVRVDPATGGHVYPIGDPTEQ